MRKEETVTGIFGYEDATGKKDFVQQITEKITVQRDGKPKQTETVSYRRVSDRAELERLSDTEFKIIATGEIVILVQRSS